MQNHFELFGLAPAYTLEAAQLEHAYREIQVKIHPDRFANAGDAERRASMQWTTHINEAYRTLKDPALRAGYLLKLNGVDVALETNTAMPAEFLMRQMEQREALELAAAERDAGALDRMRAALRIEKNELDAALAHQIDVRHDYPRAADLVRKLMFLEKLDAEIDAAFETMEG